jgi:hypothetical protein
LEALAAVVEPAGRMKKMWADAIGNEPPTR